MLEVKNINITIRKKNIIKDISFSAPKNSITGVVGKNGAGKTTLFNAIYQDISYSGNISFNNLKIKKSDISYVESENSFYQYITGNEFLDFFAFKSNSNNKNLLSEYFDIPLNTYIESLSTGERKKLAIVTNILLNKELYIFDEPFNGLDIESVNLLKALLKSKIFNNKVILISSHILSSITDLCNKIIIIENGSINHQFSSENFSEINNFLMKDIEEKVEKIQKLYENV